MPVSVLKAERKSAVQDRGVDGDAGAENAPPDEDASAGGDGENRNAEDE